MPLTEAQQTIFDDPARFRIVTAGRRFGKSFLSIWEMARAARFPNRKVFYIAPTYKMCKTIILDDLVLKLSKVNWIKKVNISDLEITLINGSKIFLRSADNPDALRGVSMDFVVLDESAMLESRLWTEICRPALADRQGKGLLISTPRGGNWFRTLYQQAQSMDDYAAYSFTTLQGGNVPAEEIEAARAEMDERTFEQEFEASFVNFSGLVYYKWSDDFIEPKTVPLIERKTQVHIGVDFNVSPLTAAIAHVADNRIHFFDEIKMDGANTYELAEELKRRYGDYRMIAYPDASGAAMKTSSVNSDHNILRQAGIEVRTGRKNPRVEDRIASVNMSMQTGQFSVSPSCRHIIKSLSSQTYLEGTRVPDKKGGLDHHSDCVGYLIHTLQPIRRPAQQPVGPQRYGLI